MSMFKRGCAVLLVTLVAACGGGSPTSPSAALDYNGNWTGTTAQGKPISFSVSGNTVTTFNVGFVVQGRFSNSSGSGSCTSDGSVTQTTTTAIAGQAFTFSGTTVSSLVGNFSSATSASGTLAFTLTNTSCTGTATTTWTATKG